jgi:hypothetical protein
MTPKAIPKIEEKKVEPPKVLEVIEEAIKEENTDNQAIKFSYPTLINKLKETSPALMTDLKAATFALDGNKLTLKFAKEWNYGRVNTPKTKNLIVETLTELFE